LSGKNILARVRRPRYC